MGKDKRIRKHKMRRQLTVTRSKAFIGFIASVLFSTLLGTFFEDHGISIYKESKAAMFGSKKKTPKASAQAKSRQSRPSVESQTSREQFSDEGDLRKQLDWETEEVESSPSENGVDLERLRAIRN